MTNSKQNISKGTANKKGMAIQEAYERIKYMLSINQLVPGQKLVYADIAKKLGMGVTPVIQALNRFEASGLLRYEANKGYFVCEVTETEVTQLYQAREALETSIVSSIIQNIKPKDITSLSTRLAKWNSDNLSRREIIRDDTRFHFALFRHAHNDVIYNLLESIFEQLYLRYRPDHMDSSRMKVVHKEHGEFLELIQNGDTDGTIALVRRHLKSSLDYVIASTKIERREF